MTRRPTGRRLGRGVALFALSLAGCQPAAQPIVLRPPAAAPRPRAEATPTPAPTRPAPARWSFSVTVRGCEARAAAPGVSLVLRTEADRTLRLALSGARGASDRTRLEFAGPDGEVSLPVRRAGSALVAEVPAGEAADRAGVLLGGGTLRPGGGPALLTVPDAGVAGRDWLGCVRSRMEG